MKVKNPATVAIAWMIALGALGHAGDSAVKIGVQIPLTGERSAVGRLIGNGLQMAVDALNSSAPSAKVELVFADDASTPEGALKSINDLVKDPKIVCVLGEINSPLVLASAPVVNTERIPNLTAGTRLPQGCNLRSSRSAISEYGGPSTRLARRPMEP
jgi:branched-chain amino acid transport system substrate-binding protein